MVDSEFASGLKPEDPSEAGVASGDLDVSHLEGAHLLADEAEHRLRALGFTDDQILSWAEAYIRAEGSGDVDELVAWIAEQERGN